MSQQQTEKKKVKNKIARKRNREIGDEAKWKQKKM